MSTKEELEAAHGELLDTEALKAGYNVIAFQAPFVVVTRKSDGKVGTFQFQHMPRYYFRWVEDK